MPVSCCTQGPARRIGKLHQGDDTEWKHTGPQLTHRLARKIEVLERDDLGWGHLKSQDIEDIGSLVNLTLEDHTL
jgi:hypothetical protein